MGQSVASRAGSSRAGTEIGRYGAAVAHLKCFVLEDPLRQLWEESQKEGFRYWEGRDLGNDLETVKDEAMEAFKEAVSEIITLESIALGLGRALVRFKRVEELKPLVGPIVQSFMQGLEPSKSEVLERILAELRAKGLLTDDPDPTEVEVESLRLEMAGVGLIPRPRGWEASMDAAYRVRRLSLGKGRGLHMTRLWHCGRLCYIMGRDLCLEDLADRCSTRSILSSAPQWHAWMGRGRSSSDEAEQEAVEGHKILASGPVASHCRSEHRPTLGRVGVRPWTWIPLSPCSRPSSCPALRCG